MSENKKKILKEKINKKNEDNLTFKIITLGNSGVGKTSIINRYANNTFNDCRASTIGVNFVIKEIFFNILYQKIKINFFFR